MAFLVCGTAASTAALAVLRRAKLRNVDYEALVKPFAGRVPMEA